MLMELLIAASCSGAVNHEACSKAVQAGTMQVGLYDNVANAEKIAQTAATKEIERTVGKTPAVLVGSAAKIYKDKAVTYSFKPTDVLSIDNVTTQVGQDKGSLSLEWRF
jgi:hypothetical protein